MCIGVMREDSAFLNENMVSPGSCKRAALREMGVKFRSSWFYAEPGFETVERAFQEAPELFDNGEIIWHTRHKMVRKVVLPEAYGGHKLAFKIYDGVTPLRYLMRCSKTALEAANYKALKKLGMPMAELVCAGDDRRNFHLRKSFFATIFAEECSDGRDFIPGGSMRGTPEEKSFIRQNMEYVARLHAVHCYHKALRVYNFLWKKRGDGEVRLVWIDVASCRFLAVPEAIFKKYVIDDLARFFRDMQLDDTELREALSVYCNNNPRTAFTLEELCREVAAEAARPR